MGLFEKTFNKIIQEDMTSGGTGSVWGGVDSGAYGNQFPSQNDRAYNPNDSRPFDPAAMVLGAKIKDKKKKRKKKRIPIQRRPLSNSL